MRKLYPTWAILVLAVLVLGFCGAFVLAADTKGKIEAIDRDAQSFTFRSDNNQETTFHMTPASKVRIDGKDGKLTDLKPGDMVTVNYEVKEKLNNVILVERK